MTNRVTGLGERLLQKRKELHYKQKDVAEKLNGISVQMLSAYEKGEQEPRLENLLKISKLYGCTVDYLCNGGNNSTQNYKINSFVDLMKMIVELDILTDVDIGSDPYQLKIYIQNSNLVNFYRDYEKIKQVRGILPQYMEQGALDNLFEQYKDIPIDEE